MSKGKRKFKRSNLERRKGAEKLLRIWYAALSAEGATTYRRGGQKASVTLAVLSEKDTLAQARKDRPHHFKGRRFRDETGQVITAALSADGKERRYIFTSDDDDYAPYYGDPNEPRVEGVGLAIRPTTVADEQQYEGYAREAMRHVAAICWEARMALEMIAAGWSFEQVAEEIDCGEPTARQLHEEGMGAIMSYQLLVKPSRMYMDESA